MNVHPRTLILLGPLLHLTSQSLIKMYRLNCTVTEDQRSLLADALYYYSEMLGNDPEGSETLNALEELEEHLDAHFKEAK